MRCPTCRKNAPFDRNPYRPFCSERCKLIDLGKWASGAFRVPDRLGGSHVPNADDEYTDGGRTGQELDPDASDDVGQS